MCHHECDRETWLAQSQGHDDNQIDVIKSCIYAELEYSCGFVYASVLIILCPRKNPKIQEFCKNKAIRRTGAKGQPKNARRNKNRLGFNLPSPSLCFSGFQTVRV
jgi:hypothetical protein